MQSDVSYHLVLESRPGDFIPIDINLLLNQYQNYNYSSIENIDKFTKNYTRQELFNMIETSNIVPSVYMNGTLKIINDNKYRYELLLKDNNFALDKFIKNNIDNKLTMNKFFNIYLKYNSSDKVPMKMALEEKNYSQIINLLLKLSYLNIRSIYLYLASNA